MSGVSILSVFAKRFRFPSFYPNLTTSKIKNCCKCHSLATVTLSSAVRFGLTGALPGQFEAVPLLRGVASSGRIERPVRPSLTALESGIAARLTTPRQRHQLRLHRKHTPKAKAESNFSFRFRPGEWARVTQANGQRSNSILGA